LGDLTAVTASRRWTLMISVNAAVGDNVANPQLSGFTALRKRNRYPSIRVVGEPPLGLPRISATVVSKLGIIGVR
jgi:hypothetical protein